MKKKVPLLHLTLDAEEPRRKAPSSLPGFFCAFLLLSFSCGSLFLNFSLIFSQDLSLLRAAGFCGLLGLLGALLFAFRKHRLFPWLFAGGLGLLLLSLLLCRKDFFSQLSSAAGAAEKQFFRLYQFHLFPGHTDLIGDKWTLFCFLAAFYLLLLLLVMLWHRRFLFVLLLGLPILFSYVLDVSEPLGLFALPLGAFVLWRGALWPQSVSRLWLLTLPFQGLLFLTAAGLLTPLFSPLIFSSSNALSQRIQTWGEQIFSSEPPASDPSRQETVPDPVFSYESPGDPQSITSSAPSFTSRTALSLSADREVSQTLYLRGFIGADYQAYQWSPPEDSQWETYAQNTGLSRRQAEAVYSPSLGSVPEKSLLSLSLDFPSTPGFSYLPLVSRGSSLFLTESNQLPQSRTSRQISGQCFPLTLDTLDSLSLKFPSQDDPKLWEAYEAFCRDRYTTWEERVPNALLQELFQLPVYLSMPETPSDQDIQEAAEEIRTFLWKHASYSTALEPFSQDTPLCQELLYDQHKGFCIHFATVGTQLFRLYGIPARYVSGYCVPADMLRETSQGNFTADVPDSQAHAWVEVYTQQAGWVPVEVTPTSSREALPDGTLERKPAPENTDTEKSTGSAEALHRDSKEDAAKKTDSSVLTVLALAGKGLLLTVLLLVLLFLLLLFLRRQLFFLRLGYFARSTAQAYRIQFKSLTRLLELKFSIKPQASSDQEYFRLLCAGLPEKERETFQRFHAQAEAFSYGTQKPSPADLRRLRGFYLRQRKAFLQSKKRSGSLSPFLDSFRV